MADLILPGAEYRLSPHRPNGSEPRRGDLPPRAVIHTTETDPGTLDAVARNLEWPYHLLVDVKNRRIRQLIRSLDRTAYSLRAARFETNHAGSHCVQISLVMRAKDAPSLSDGDLDWLTGAVLRPVSDLCGIPNAWLRFYGPNEGIVLASMSSPARMTVSEWYGFSGWCGHQHVPGQDHWDPGALNYRRLMDALEDDVIPMSEWMREFNQADTSEPNGVVEMVQRFLKARGLYGGAVDGLRGMATDMGWAGWEQSIGAPNVNRWAGQVSWDAMLSEMFEPCPPAHAEDPRVAELEAKVGDLTGQVIGLAAERDDARVERDAAAEVAQARGDAIQEANQRLSSAP